MEPIISSNIKGFIITKGKDSVYIQIVWKACKNCGKEHKSLPHRFTKEQYKEFKKDMEISAKSEYIWEKLRT